MILSMFRKKPADDAVFTAYAALVAQARRPIFYAEWGVPDTVTGRFDMISLHMALALRRLRQEPTATAAFGQALFDFFFRDMDRSLREMGAGDLAVPKKIQKMGNLFYGLSTSLDRPLDAGDESTVATVLTRNIYSEVDAADATRLAGYTLRYAAALAGVPVEAVMAGTIPQEVA